MALELASKTLGTNVAEEHVAFLSWGGATLIGIAMQIIYSIYKKSETLFAL